MSSPRIDWSIPQRQAWAAIFIILYKVLLAILKAFWWLILLYFFRNKPNKFDAFELMVVGLSIFSLLRSVLEFAYFRFYIRQDDLVIKSGFLTKKTTSLPLDKIQAVHIEQTWLHGLFNAARLSFDSAGSEKIEAKIDAISKTDAEDFKSFILHSRPGAIASAEAAVAPEPDEVLIRLTGNDLLRLSLSANHLEAFLLMLAFFLSTLEQIREVFNVEYTRFVGWLQQLSNSTAASLLAGTIIALVVSVIISTVRVLIRYYDFRITRSSKGFFIHSGLINIQEKLVPFKKVQFISWRANWLRRRMGLYLLQFRAIGAEEMKEKLRIKVPVTNASMIPLLLENYHPLLQINELPATRIHPAFVERRILVLGVLPLLLLAGPAIYFFQWNALWLLLYLLFVSISRFLFQQKFRLWTEPDAFQIRRGILGIEELVVRWDMVQSVSLEQSIYQKTKQLATLVLYTAGGRITIPYIPLQEAQELMNYAVYKAES
jgi:putative membrane protein